MCSGGDAMPQRGGADTWTSFQGQGGLRVAIPLLGADDLNVARRSHRHRDSYKSKVSTIDLWFRLSQLLTAPSIYTPKGSQTHYCNY